jgi:hypothetical protein
MIFHGRSSNVVSIGELRLAHGESVATLEPTVRMTRRRAVTYRGIGEFFREGGVLVTVFGILDHVVHQGTITQAQVAGAFGLGVVLLIVGLMFDTSAEEPEE